MNKTINFKLKEDLELLRNHNDRMKNYRQSIDSEGVIVVLEKSLKAISKYTEEDWNTIQYTANKKLKRKEKRQREMLK